MPPSESIGSYPVIRHYYPINPETASQQSWPVYNPPSAPLVAPIRPSAYPQPREPTNKTSKRVYEDGEQQLEAILTSPPQRPKRVKRDNRAQGQKVDVVPIRLPPNAQRSKVYVELPVPKFLDRPLYKPFSQASYSANHIALGRGKRKLTLKSPTRLNSSKPRVMSSPSIASDHSHDTDMDDPHQTDMADRGNGKATRRKTLRNRKNRDKKSGILEKKLDTKLAEACKEDTSGDEEASTCHQCRRKSTNAKMKCRKVRDNDIVCTLFFCQRCIRVRYGEVFDPDHRWWHCPRCRKMCNCSICLRKAGLGYVLDDLGEQMSGTPGRLSMRQKSRSKGDGKASEGVSVHELLMRRGIALGTDKNINKLSEQVVRDTATTSLPPLDGPSLHEDSPCDDTDEDVDNIGFPLDPQLLGEGGIAPNVQSPLRNKDDSAGSKVRTAETRLKKESARNVRYISPSRVPQLLQSPGGKFHVWDTATLDDSRPPSARSRLNVDGSPLQPSVEIEYGSPMAKRSKAGKSKTKTDGLDYEPSGKKGPNTSLPTIRVRQPHAIPALDEDEKYEVSDTESSFGGSEHARTLMRGDDAPTTPSPAPEPMLVPTEHYTPSKLDPTRVRDLDASFAPPFWALNTNAETGSGVQGHVAFSYFPPTSASDAEVSPSHAGPTIFSSHQSSSTSRSALLNDHFARDPGYAVSGLSYVTMDETWIAGGGSASGSGIGMDVPLQMEHLVDGAE